MRRTSFTENYQGLGDLQKRSFLTRGAILVLLFALAIHTTIYLLFAIAAVNYPFSLDYGEGIVWQQALLMLGPRMYGDITHYPFIVFHYPPIYYLFVRALISLGIDGLASGRAISIIATLVTCVLLGAITIHVVRQRVSTTACVVGGVVAGLMPFTYQPVQEWSMLMRVDMLAIMFTTAGIYVTMISSLRTGALCAATFLFILAVYTKQTELSAPIAALVVVGAVNLRAAAKALLFGLLVGGTALVALEARTGGGFLRHILGYNLNRFTFSHLAREFWEQRFDIVAVLVALAAFWLLWQEAIERFSPNKFAPFLHELKESIGFRAFTMVSVWILLSSVMLITAGKRGSYHNYFIEWLIVASIPIGVLMAAIWDGAQGIFGIQSVANRSFVALLLPAVLIASILFQPVRVDQEVYDSRGFAIQTQLVERIRASKKPVMSEDMSLLLRAGKEVPVEPAIFKELADAGVWDQQRLLGMLQHRDFGFVIDQKYGLDRFTPEMEQQIKRSYPNVETVGNFVLHQPTVR